MNVKTGKYFPKANCNTLQHLATRCNILQHPATPCNTPRHTAANSTPCNTLQHPATPCNTLQYPATLCNTLQHRATPCNTLHPPNAGARQHVMPPVDALLLLCLPLHKNSRKVSCSRYAYYIS